MFFKMLDERVEVDIPKAEFASTKFFIDVERLLFGIRFANSEDFPQFIQVGASASLLYLTFNTADVEKIVQKGKSVSFPLSQNKKINILPDVVYAGNEILPKKFGEIIFYMRKTERKNNEPKSAPK